MATAPYLPATPPRALVPVGRYSALRPCGCSGFWMRVLIWASRRAAR